MSSHREAPGIAKDPVADNTDLYAFVSPDDPNTVTILANFIPLEYPPGGPNFFEFGDDVTYAIHISNDGSPDADITYRFRFHTNVRNHKTVPVQHRTDHVARQPELEPPPVLHGVEGRPQGAATRSWART